MAMAALEQEANRPDSIPLLRPGTTCWRVEQAERATVLVDGAAYYSAVRAAILKARKTIFIVGWDIDSRVRLCPIPGAGAQIDSEDPDAPVTLGDLLAYVAARRPQICIRLLLWNYSILYAAEREPLQSFTLGWSTPRQVKVCFDDALPLGASHHQKIVVVDDAVAFSGGLDLTSRRWDTAEHRPDNPDRVDPRGAAYAPFHDVQMAVDGGAALALGDMVRERWRRACGRKLPVVGLRRPEAPDPWPRDLEPDFRRVGIGIARTRAPFAGREGVREVEALLLTSIASAERSLYIENQYLTSERLAEALCRRLRERPRLEVVIVGPREPKGWLEAKSMGAGRVRFRRCLEDAGVSDRVRLLYPYVEHNGARQAVMVHAKVMAVDDRLLRIGSANLNNRSMGFDTECDLAVEATTPEMHRTVERLRNTFLAEHLGVTVESVKAAMDRDDSLLAIVDGLGGEGRGLAPIEDSEAFDDEIGQTLRSLADPEQPIDPDELISGMFGVSPQPRRFAPLLRVGAVVVVLLALLLLWQVTPLAEYASPDRLAPLLDSVADQAWAPLALLGAYVAGGLVMFPVTVLIALTAMTFGPWEGAGYAAAGCLLSAGITYHVGRLVARSGWFGGSAGPRVRRVSRRLANQGVLSVMILRMVPIAPFTVVNLSAGASHIRFRDYMIGTVLGMAPGIAIMTALGDRLRSAWENPSWAEGGLLVLVLILWIGLTVALQRAVSRLRG